MKKSLLITLLGLGLAVSICTEAHAAPQITKLKLEYRGDSGLLTIYNRFTQGSRAQCTFRIRASVSYENSTEVESIRTVLKTRIKNPETARFNIRLLNLPAVATDDEGNRPQLNMQTSLDCGARGRAVSLPAAEFVICGTGTEEVSPLVFLRRLQSRLIALGIE